MVQRHHELQNGDDDRLDWIVVHVNASDLETSFSFCKTGEIISHNERVKLIYCAQHIGLLFLWESKRFQRVKVNFKVIQGNLVLMPLIRSDDSY